MGANAQTPSDDPQRFFGHWHLVEVLWELNDEEYLRKELGTINKEFDSERFDKNRRWIDDLLSKGHYKLSIQKSDGRIEGDTVTYRNNTKVVHIEYSTACNNCSGNYLMLPDGSLTPVGIKRGCTAIWCAIENVIHPFNQNGLILNSDTLMMPLPNGRVYYFTK